MKYPYLKRRKGEPLEDWLERYAGLLFEQDRWVDALHAAELRRRILKRRVLGR